MGPEDPAGPQPDSDGNYPSPPLSALQRCWEDYLAGQAGDEDLLQTLQAYSDRVQFELDRLEGQVVAGLSSPKDPIFAAIMTGFEAQLSAVERMARELDDPEQGHMEIGLELAQRANNQLMRAHLDLIQRTTEQSQLTCPFCSARNLRGEERCGQCSRPLPEGVESAAPRSSFTVVQAEGLQTPGEGRPMTANALELTRAVAAYQHDQLDDNDLYTLLDELESRIMGNQEANRRASAEEGDPGELLAAVDPWLERSLEALDHMRLAWDKDDDSYLETGLDQFQQASDELLKLYEQLKQLRAPQP